MKLTAEERQEMKASISSGGPASLKVIQARTLVKADDRETDKSISVALSGGPATVERLRKRFAE